MKNTVGVVTSTYPNYGTEEALDGISGAGFEYVELATCPGFFEHISPRPEDMQPGDEKKVLDLCKKYGLKLQCVAAHTRMMKEDTVKNFKAVIDFASRAGVNFITTDAGEVKDSTDEKKFYSDISELAAYAKDRKVTICLEMHGNWCNTAEKGSEIIKKINHPNVKLNYDTSNVIMYGETRPERDIDKAIPYMGYLHLKDHGTGKAGEWNFPALGEGVVDFDKIFDSIKDYSGPISVEIEFDGKERKLETINEAVRKSYEFLKSYGYV